MVANILVLLLFSIGTSIDNVFIMEMYIEELVLVVIYLCSVYIKRNKNIRGYNEENLYGIVGDFRSTSNPVDFYY